MDYLHRVLCRLGLHRFRPGWKRHWHYYDFRCIWCGKKWEDDNA